MNVTSVEERSDENNRQRIRARGMLLIGSVASTHAQIATGLDFTTTFPFYAQNTKLPAGSYTATQADFDKDTLLIRSTDGQHSVFVDVIPTQSEKPHQTTDVTFHKYGSVEYLKRLWVEGQPVGLKVEPPTKAEKKAAQTTNPTEHSIAGKKH